MCGFYAVCLHQKCTLFNLPRLLGGSLEWDGVGVSRCCVAEMANGQLLFVLSWMYGLAVGDALMRVIMYILSITSFRFRLIDVNGDTYK